MPRTEGSDPMIEVAKSYGPRWALASYGPTETYTLSELRKIWKDVVFCVSPSKEWLTVLDERGYFVARLSKAGRKWART